MTTIVGRAAEVSALATLIDRASEQRGEAVVLRGEAGIGKSVLLEQVIRAGRERGMRVLSVTGVQAEVHFPFAGIDHLLRPLRSAPRTTESPYLLTLEALELLDEQSEPALLTVDDAHWLDSASWTTLTFLCRRIESDSIAVIMAVREGEDIDRRLSAAGLPELRLEPLSAVDAGTLLDLAAPGLVPALRARVLDESAGNPWASWNLARRSRVPAAPRSCRRLCR